MLSLITPTARREPCFAEMAHSLADAHQFAPEIAFEWIVVDAVLWYDPCRVHELCTVEDYEFPILHIPPKVSWQHPKFGKVPTPNAARNTGIIYAQGDFVVFLDDCSVVHPNFFAKAADAGRRGSVVRFPHMRKQNLIMPKEIPTGGSYHRIDKSGLRGSGVGFPLEVLLDLNGFDEAYDGFRKEDLEIGLRVANMKVPIEETFGTLIVESDHDQLFPDVATANEHRLNRLSNDDKVIKPSGIQTNIRAVRDQINEWLADG